MWMPTSVAASSTSWPLGARVTRPSMVTSTRPSSGGGGAASAWLMGLRGLREQRRAHRAGAGATVGLELGAEGLVRGDHEPGRGVPERTEALAVHVRADVGERRELVEGREARLELVHQPGLEVRALAAGHALAAGLVVVEVDQAPGDVDEAGGLVHEHHRAGAERGARLHHRVHVEGEVEVLGEEHLHRAAAGLERLERPPLPHPAAVLLEELANRPAELHLVAAGMLDVPGAAPHPGAAAALGADRLEPLPTAGDDVGQVAEGLDVVHHRRLAVEALDRGEGRLEPRLAAPALEGVDERGLLAADVGAGAAVDDDVATEVGAEDALADIALGARLLDAALEQQPLVVILPADVEEGVLHLERIGGDEDPLDQLMGVLVDEVAVLEAAGLGLVGVDAEVAGEHVAGEERPLRPGGEAGPSAAPQPAELHLLDDLVGSALPQRGAQRLVAAPPLVDGEGLDALDADVLGEQLVLGHRALILPGGTARGRRTMV